MQQGRLFVISGPSGAGKGTICSALIAGGGFELSVSMTTRAPRTGEVEGVNYYFVSKRKFRSTIKKDGLLEYAQIYENYYGTPKAPVLAKLAEGKDVILEIEMIGAAKVKAAYPEAILIFVLPPSLSVLASRLAGRGTETPDQIALRSRTALDEIGRIGEYDYYVINDELETAVATVRAITEGRAEENRVAGKAEAIIERYREEL